MNAKNRSTVRVGWILSCTAAVAASGCTSSHVHTRTVYVPSPPPPARVVYVTPTPAPATASVVLSSQPVAASVAVVPSLSVAPAVAIQTESDFYEPLAEHGRWEAVAGYGRCWIPARVEVGWRPYCDGYWRRTDAGWYWMSNEPWGWATYHYGRWDWQMHLGWFWVPQTQWSPAWVCWREGGGYVGWAPLRPSVTFGVNFHFGDYEPAHAARAYVFVEKRRMLEPVRPRTVIVNNTTIINKTVNITNIKVENKTVINEGPRVEVVERETGRKVRSVAAREARHEEEKSVTVRGRNALRGAERRIESQVIAEVRTAPVVERTPVAPAARPLGPTTAPVVRTAPELPAKSKAEVAVVPKIENRGRAPANVPRTEIRNEPEPKTTIVNPNRAVSRRTSPQVDEREATPRPVTPPTGAEARRNSAPAKVEIAAPAAAPARARTQAGREMPTAYSPAVRAVAASPQAAQRPAVEAPAQRGKRPSLATDAKPEAEARSAADKPQDEGKGKRPAKAARPDPADEPSRS